MHVPDGYVLVPSRHLAAIGSMIDNILNLEASIASLDASKAQALTDLSLVLRDMAKHMQLK